MKRRILLISIFIVMIAYLAFTSYLWYFFFLDLSSDGTLGKKQPVVSNLSFIDESKIYATYEQGTDTNQHALGYRFRVVNNGIVDIKYRLKIVEIDPSVVNDGCTVYTLLKRKELNYSLRLNNEIIKEGSLDELENSIIDEREMNVNGDNKYELQIWINSKAVDYQEKHYHYKVKVEVVE